jgi:hypothetical protein
MKKRHKHRYQKYDSSLPPIEIHPNLNPDNAEHLPDVIYECEETNSETANDRILALLRFVDRADLFRLSSIRVVSDGTLKLPSDVTTTGMYYPAFRDREAEIRISADLFKPRNVFAGAFNWFSGKDDLLETLYHEIGHHKAYRTPMVSKYKQEAFAERYMLAYKKAWMRHHGISRIGRRITFYLILPFMFLMALIFQIIMPKKPILKLVFRRWTGKITRNKYSAQWEQMMTTNSATALNKRKWIHPLNKSKYLDKFHLDSR